MEPLGAGIPWFESIFRGCHSRQFRNHGGTVLFQHGRIFGAADVGFDLRFEFRCEEFRISEDAIDLGQDAVALIEERGVFLEGVANVRRERVQSCWWAGLDSSAFSNARRLFRNALQSVTSR